MPRTKNIDLHEQSKSDINYDFCVIGDKITPKIESSWFDKDGAFAVYSPTDDLRYMRKALILEENKNQYVADGDYFGYFFKPKILGIANPPIGNGTFGSLEELKGNGLLEDDDVIVSNGNAYNAIVYIGDFVHLSLANNFVESRQLSVQLDVELNKINCSSELQHYGIQFKRSDEIDTKVYAYLNNSDDGAYEFNDTLENLVDNFVDTERMETNVIHYFIPVTQRPIRDDEISMVFSKKLLQELKESEIIIPNCTTRVKIPPKSTREQNKDVSWDFFDVKPIWIQENQNGKSVTLYLPQNDNTQICYYQWHIGNDGRRHSDMYWNNIPNIKIKNMLEAYKEQKQTKYVIVDKKDVCL